MDHIEHMMLTDIIMKLDRIEERVEHTDQILITLLQGEPKQTTETTEPVANKTNVTPKKTEE